MSNESLVKACKKQCTSFKKEHFDEACQCKSRQTIFVKFTKVNKVYEREKHMNVVANSNKLKSTMFKKSNCFFFSNEVIFFDIFSGCGLIESQMNKRKNMVTDLT